MLPLGFDGCCFNPSEFELASRILEGTSRFETERLGKHGMNAVRPLNKASAQGHPKGPRLL